MARVMFALGRGDGREMRGRFAVDFAVASTLVFPVCPCDLGTIGKRRYGSRMVVWRGERRFVIPLDSRNRDW